ncbi:MAG: carbamoyltransferase [Planctomycetes bacterium]|nr:carbamoyltransferase [Planctomycetota bacterium]
MRILGLNHDMFISSAALIEDGRVVAAAAEERFNRAKRSRAFPEQAIRYCLAEAGIGIDEVDAFAASWNPAAYFRKFNPLFSNQRRHMAEHLYSVPDHLLRLFPSGEHGADWIEQRLPVMGAERRIIFVSHHRAHIGNAYHLSPFEDAAIITADSQGEYEATTFSVGRGGRTELLRAIDYPQSIGAYYSTFTEYLGFQPNSDEWKVMALGAYEEGENPFDAILRDEVVTLLPDGGYEFDLSFFQGYMPEKPNLFSDRLLRAFGPPRLRDEPLEPRHYQIAAAVQRRSEDIAFHMMRKLHEQTGLDRLCLAGGFFMNSLLNGKILRETPFEQVFISSCPDDSGNAIGAALYVQNDVLGHLAREPMRHNYWGPEHDDDEIAATIERYGLVAERHDDIAAVCAAQLAEGKLVGWFQGRMEFGQRALGNRSILADPRRAATRDQVNLAVKYRESFRPFAPAILAEQANDWFDLPEGAAAPYMEQVHMVREDRREAIAAVVHADGSGRLQTVEAATNPRFHALISAFAALTGVPVVLNTSFNLNGEPVVCTPTDAIRTFHSCGLDVLALGSYLIRKGR